MELSTDWAKAEVFSAKMVGLYSLLILFVAIGFWQLGKTAMAKAFVYPLLVAAAVILLIGAGLYWANKPRITQFVSEYNSNPQIFVQKEIERTAKSKRELAMVFKVLPAIIIVAALLILFFDAPWCRAIGITSILVMVSLMVVDSNTDARNTAYHQQLLKIDQYEQRTTRTGNY